MDKETLLYKYFSNSLTQAEQVKFEKILTTDAEFKAQFEFEQNLQQAINTEKSADLKQKLQGFERKFQEAKPVQKSSFSVWKIAASVALLIMASYFGYQSFFAEPDFSKIYADNYKVYPNTVYTITRGDDDNSLERQAFVAYETEEYQKAIDKFNEATPQKYFNFYKAQSFLKLDKTEEAKDLFEEIITNKQQFTAESLWYLALLNLKENNISEAKKHLQNLTANFGYNKEKALEILKQLN